MYVRMYRTCTVQAICTQVCMECQGHAPWAGRQATKEAQIFEFGLEEKRHTSIHMFVWKTTQVPPAPYRCNGNEKQVNNSNTMLK